MSSSRDHISFTGVPGISLAIEDRLPDVVERGRAPAEAAAQEGLVDLALVDRQARRPPHVAASACSPFCDRGPHLALVRRIERGGVLRLHGDVVLVRIGVDRLDLLGGAGERRFDVAALVADEGLLGIEACLEHVGDRCARHLGVGAVVPLDRQRFERGLGVPPGIGDDRDGVVLDLHDFLDAAHARRPWRRRSS